MKTEKLIEKKEHFGWLDSIRGIAILWIFLVHFIERFMSGSFFANPGMSWPAFNERFAQLVPLEGPLLSAIVANAFRYIGWLGDQGVQLFLVASGFGLTYSALKSSKKIEFFSFIKKRLGRIMPEWWVLHILFIITFLLIGFGLPPTSWRTVASFIGIRFLPSTMYYFSPAWWFIGLLIQLYLIFPFLFRYLQGEKMIRRIILIIIGAVVIRAVGLIIFDKYLDWWSRGAVFISRFPDFGFGMLLAALVVKHPEVIKRYTTGLKSFLLWFTIWMIGNITSFFLLGMSVAFLLTAAGLFMMLYMAANSIQANTNSPIKWLGRNSYSLFLVHHPIIFVLVPSTLSAFATVKMVGLFVITGGLTLIIGILLSKGTKKVTVVLSKWLERGGWNRLIFRSLSLLVLIAVLFISIELLMRAVAPQEVLGWGERVSLIPDRELGYKLKPDSEHRLRWLSYDYTVKSNKLGFPGPLYPEKTEPETIRILVTGDAFESAEGVDTHDAWPILLEGKYTESLKKTQVLNFSITGWGPQHYKRAVEKYAPKYNPDLILVGFFINEFFDVTITDQRFNESIGFHRADQNGIYSVLKMVHTQAALKRLFKDWFPSFIRGNPTNSGRHLANLALFERKNAQELKKNSEMVKNYIKSILNTAQNIGSRLMIVLVPSSVQVCDPDDLAYLTRGVDPASSEDYDLDQPQRLAKEIFKELNIEYFDLRPALSDAEGCPYQSRNMHWTEYGHQIVANAVADELHKRGFLSQ